MPDAVSGHSAERKEDFGKGRDGEIKRWLAELSQAKKGRRKTWLAQYNKIVQRYRDEAKAVTDGGATTDDDSVELRAGFNLLWSNVRTTGPAIYSKPPKVIVERRHKDDSLIARAACVILQRGLGYQMRVNFEQFHTMMKACRLDYQLGGFTEATVRYKRHYGEGDKGHEYSNLSTPARPEEEQGQGYGRRAALPSPPDGIKPWENVVDEELCFDYQHPEDFLCAAGRTWSEVNWVAFRSHLTRDQVERTAIFGDQERRKKIAKSLSYTSKPEGMTSDDAKKEENGVLMRCPIWAIWDRTDRKIIYISETWPDEIIATKEDPSTLDGFFPCPPPAVSTSTNNTVWPVPDYIEYGAQAREVDELTIRADAVLDAIRVMGVYDGAHEELRQLLDGGYENKLLSVRKWREFSEKGGLENAVDFMPIDLYAKVLEILYNARVVAKQDADQMSGVFDIMRGQSNANETLGAQKLKAGYGEQRANEPKETLATFARNVLAIGGEMMAEHFSDASLWQMSDFGNWWKTQERGLKAKAARGMPQMAGGAMPAPQMGQPAPQPAPGPGAPAGGTVLPFPAPGGAQPMPSGGTPLPPSPPAGAGYPGAGAAGAMPGAPAPMPSTPPLPSAEEVFRAAVELLRNEKLRGFTITVETNSTIEPDAAVEQQRRTQFLETMAMFMEKAMALGAALPEAVPLIAQMLLFAVRSFGESRELETVFEVFLDKMVERAENPPPKPPSPEELKAKSEEAKILADKEAQERQAQMDERKLQAELQMARETHQMDMERMQMEMQLAEVKLQLAMQEAQLKLQMQQQANEIKLQGEKQKQVMQEREMVREDEMAEREGQRAEQAAQREDEFAERSMEREEGHQERMMKTKEKQAAKPKPAGGEK